MTVDINSSNWKKYQELEEKKLNLLDTTKLTHLTDQQREQELQEVYDQMDQLEKLEQQRQKQQKQNNHKQAAEAEDKPRKEIFVQRYTRDNSIAEAVIIGDKPRFAMTVPKLGRIEKPNEVSVTLVDEIQIEKDNVVIKPLRLQSYINKPYTFDSKFNSKEEFDKAVEKIIDKVSLDSLYRRAKSIWRKYIDADDFHISICAADTIFTYFQDKIGLTHYLFFVGGNNSGKSNDLTMLNLLAYRNMTSTDITSANIYQFLGSGEEGIGTICEDEADNIDQDHDKMKIYKNGYTTGRPVLRTDTSFGRQQLKLNTFGFKAFGAEKLPDSIIARGFNQRTIEIKCITGNPSYDISEIVNPAGDQENQALLDELLDFRNTLLIYRLLHFHEPIPDIKDLNIQNREKQLFKPLIRLFQNEECLPEILKVISEYISKKRADNVDNFQARIYNSIKDMIVREKKIEFNSGFIWETIKDGLGGNEIPGRPMSYDSDDFDIISQKEIITLLKEVFGAEPPKHKDTTRKLVFNQDKLDRLDKVYNLELEIKVGRRSNADIGLDEHIEQNSTTIEENLTVADEADVEDVGGIKADPDTTVIEESTKIQQENDKFSSINQENKEKITTENDANSHIHSQDRHNPPHPPQPIAMVSLEDFFYTDKPVPEHTFEQSPCYPIIYKEGDYYHCKLHTKVQANPKDPNARNSPVLRSIHLEEIERHCRYTDPGVHLKEIQKRLELKAQGKSWEI